MLVSILVAFALFCVLSYHRASLIIWTISYALLLILVTRFVGATLGVYSAWIIYALIFAPLNILPLRKRFISLPVLKLYRKIMPNMSRTEREAIAAGTVSFEAELFRGNPNWIEFLKQAPARLSAEEQAFIDGPVEQLCQMINDFEITHQLADLPPSMWQFIKSQGFFGLIIPKQYGGKEFSAYAHSQILTKISGLSVTAGTTVAVPNSLGPAELLLHYGTEAQRNYYLPRLARGEEIPCFALTSPEAGSDAGSMTDHGIVCWGEYEGKRTLGVRLNFHKRYITLAPVATVVGLAFKMYDPEHLVGEIEDIGITCALIPRNTPGVNIGRRHYPAHTPFMNGPVSGKDVFIPLDYIIGGVEQAGCGWKMLMECLAAGRAITLPASALGGSKLLSYVTGAYARIRKQFNLSIGRFEGIEEPLARIAAFTYIIDAGRSLTASAIDSGHKPSVASAIIKYNLTELGRRVANDGMDIHGGKGICLGPKNYLAGGYQAMPIAITVEGANILTRSLIVFGQGAMRCHPYVFAELEAAKESNASKSLSLFDKAFIKHVAFGMSNVVRTFLLGVSSSYFVQAPKTSTKRYFQHATRFSSAFALVADVAMLQLGGSLKRKESLSGRFADILSHLYLLSAVLKLYHDQGSPAEDLPLVRYASEHCLYQVQESFNEILRNFPNRFVALWLKTLVFPFGSLFNRPKDRYNHKLAQALIAVTATRERLAAGAAIHVPMVADIQDAFVKVIAAEPVEKIIKKAYRDKLIAGYTLIEQAQEALKQRLISEEQFDQFMQAETAKQKVIAVDDFANEDLARNTIKNIYTNLYAESNGTNG
jgi:acyl-CoA dehydrogenase